jgi:hypothetical protein
MKTAENFTEIASLDEIKHLGKYVLKDHPKHWFEIQELNGSFAVFGPIGRKGEEMYMTVKDQIKYFKSIHAVVNHLKNSAKRNFWNMRQWIVKPSYSERLISDHAEVYNIEKGYASVKSTLENVNVLRIGWDTPSDVVVGEIGELYYVSTHNSGLIKFRRKKK